MCRDHESPRCEVIGHCNYKGARAEVEWCITVHGRGDG